MIVHAFILIGDRSSRLGRDKAFVEFDGESLAKRALTTVRNAGIAEKITFVTGSQTQFAIEAITLDAPFIFDLVPDRGPLGGLHAAMSYAQTPWIFLLACDYPFVTPELLRSLAEKVSDEFGVVVPEQPDGRLQPLCAFYNVNAALPVVEEIINRPRVSPSMHEVVELLNPRVVKPHEYDALSTLSETCFININVEEGLEPTRKIRQNGSGSDRNLIFTQTFEPIRNPTGQM